MQVECKVFDECSMGEVEESVVMKALRSNEIATYGIGAAFLAVLLVAQVASAQKLKLVNDVAEYLQNFMTGRLATSLAVIAVAVVGYLF